MYDLPVTNQSGMSENGVVNFVVVTRPIILANMASELCYRHHVSVCLDALCDWQALSRSSKLGTVNVRSHNIQLSRGILIKSEKRLAFIHTGPQPVEALFRFHSSG